jgi:hypothetical protein
MAEDPKVLRRCPRCRLLFEASKGNPHCLACGDSVEGLALPLPPADLGGDDDSVPHEIHERQPTERVRRD